MAWQAMLHGTHEAKNESPRLSGSSILLVEGSAPKPLLSRVLAGCVSFASPQAARLIHCAARPFPTKPRLCGGPLLCGGASFGCLWSRISSALFLLLFVPGFVCVLAENLLRIGAVGEQLFHLVPRLPVLSISRFFLGEQGGVFGLQALDRRQLL